MHATIHFLGTKLTKKARKESKEFVETLSKI